MISTGGSISAASARTRLVVFRHLAAFYGFSLLQQVAARLQACMRPGDTVARLGGDEFVVVMHELATHADRARQRARRAAAVILQALSQPYELAGQPYHGTCSIGVTLLSDHEHSLADLLKQEAEEYAVLAEVKQACLRAGIDVKKSELLRIGVALLGQVDIATLKSVLAALPQLKTGRPPAAP